MTRIEKERGYKYYDEVKSKGSFLRKEQVTSKIVKEIYMYKNVEYDFDFINNQLSHIEIWCRCQSFEVFVETDNINL